MRVKDTFQTKKKFLRHRIVCNYKAEAEGITVEKLVGELV